MTKINDAIQNAEEIHSRAAELSDLLQHIVSEESKNMTLSADFFTSLFPLYNRGKW